MKGRPMAEHPRDDLAAELRLRQTTGFPSPVEDYFEAWPLDLNRLLIVRPTSTFFMLVQGDGLQEQGIRHGDIVVVDRAAPIGKRCVAVVSLEGELRLRLIGRKRNRLIFLHEASDVDAPGGEEDVQLWGVVLYALHPLIRSFPHRFWEATVES